MEGVSHHIFGPVYSRRLGYSLGIDLVPYKTCNLNCVYCELGRTTRQTMRRTMYLPVDSIIDELRRALEQHHRADFITLTGSGEPTLHAAIGDLIRQIKEISAIPLCVLTNGTLLYLPKVRTALLPADVVAPLLDAATPAVFQRIDRPHGHLRLQQVIEGLVAFREAYQGQLWLEILFVRGLNDTLHELQALRNAVDRIRPDCIHLNTVVRPPAERGIEAVPPAKLKAIQRFFSSHAEIVTYHPAEPPAADGEALSQKILHLAERRPVTISDITRSFGVLPDDAIRVISDLVSADALVPETYGHEVYFKAIHPSTRARAQQAGKGADSVCSVAGKEKKND